MIFCITCRAPSTCLVVQPKNICFYFSVSLFFTFLSGGTETSISRHVPFLSRSVMSGLLHDLAVSVCHSLLVPEYSDSIILTWCNWLWTCTFHLPFFTASCLFTDIKIFSTYNQSCRFMKAQLWFSYSWKSSC